MLTIILHSLSAIIVCCLLICLCTNFVHLTDDQRLANNLVKRCRAVFTSVSEVTRLCFGFELLRLLVIV